MPEKFINSVNAVCSRVDAIAGIVAFCALVIMLISISMQIFFRIYLDALSWTEELARYMLVWVTFLGATMAYRRGLHITVTFVVDLLPQSLRRAIRITAILASLFFFGLIMFYALRFMQFQSSQLTPSLRIPIYLVYAIMPISLGVMLLHGLHALLLEICPTAKAVAKDISQPNVPENSSVNHGQ